MRLLVPASPARPRRLLAALVACLVGASLLTVAGPASPAAAYPAANIELKGHGNGHGRGMGQWGALGFALAGTTHTGILDYFYGGTVAGAIGNLSMSVRLARLDNLETVVVQEKGQATSSAHPGQTFTALRARMVAPATFEVASAPGCGGPWTVISAAIPGPITFASALGQTDRTTMLQVCEPTSTRWYRGDIQVVDNGGSRTVNRLLIEEYLKGVVPREVPANWGDMGNRAGMHALRAQAVAARSYAQAQNRYPYAKTCDTETCQVYSGFAVQDAGGYRELEQFNTNMAIAETAGQVRHLAGTSTVASTEFSSSTGGYSAGGTFPAVLDAGDDIPQNPHHNWTAAVPVASVEAAYPAIGQLQSVDVIRRNGLGDMGGRVLELVLVGNLGRQTITGDDFRIKFGLKSNWFRVTNNAGGGVAGYWVVAQDGGIFAFGAAKFFGSMGGKKLNQPILAMVATPTGNGYWLVAADGGIFSFGDATFWGSTGALKLNQPVVGMASSPTGKGYWLVARDGGIFAFGDATFAGSTGAITLNQPIIGMASTPTAAGYWLAAADGGIFAFGDAKYLGSLPELKAPGPARGMQATRSGAGYLMVNDAGKVFAFGDAPFLSDVATAVPGYKGGVRGITARYTL